jgi:hypothetical protein
LNVDKLVIYQGPQLEREPAILEKKPLIQEKIRLDVAAPEMTHLNEPFDLAVAVRQPYAPLLAIEDLSKVASAAGSIFRAQEDDVVKYRIQVTGAGCEITPPNYVIKLRPNENSNPYFFQVTPQRPGVRSLFVTAYQEDEALAAQTRLTIQVQVPVD